MVQCHKQKAKASLNDKRNSVRNGRSQNKIEPEHFFRWQRCYDGTLNVMYYGPKNLCGDLPGEPRVPMKQRNARQKPTVAIELQNF